MCGWRNAKRCKDGMSFLILNSSRVVSVCFLLFVQNVFFNTAECSTLQHNAFSHYVTHPLQQNAVK